MASPIAAAASGADALHNYGKTHDARVLRQFAHELRVVPGPMALLSALTSNDPDEIEEYLETVAKAAEVALERADDLRAKAKKKAEDEAAEAEARKTANREAEEKARASKTAPPRATKKKVTKKAAKKKATKKARK